MLGKRDRHKQDDIVGLLGNGTIFEGVLKFTGTIRIEGSFTGEVNTDGMVIIGDTARVNAQIHARTIVIHGEMRGEIDAHEKLEIKTGGKLFGNVTTSSLVIEPGVVFNGLCRMVREKSAQSGGKKAPELSEQSL
ncbi:MAG: polymer-forming cytoskeletal protein [Desulfomonilia bacterium]|jgi:cytoskeletal protein CcmA (bactofilin family)